MYYIIVCYWLTTVAEKILLLIIHRDFFAFFPYTYPCEALVSYDCFNRLKHLRHLSKTYLYRLWFLCSNYWESLLSYDWHNFTVNTFLATVMPQITFDALYFIKKMLLVAWHNSNIISFAHFSICTTLCVTFPLYMYVLIPRYNNAMVALPHTLQFVNCLCGMWFSDNSSFEHNSICMTDCHILILVICGQFTWMIAMNPTLTHDLNVMTM